MRQRLLAWLRVSELPDPPPGSGPELATFRASRRFLYLSALTWLPKQLSALAGLLFALAFFGTIDTPFLSADGFDRFMDWLEGFQNDHGRISLSPRGIFNFLELMAVFSWLVQLVVSGLMIKLTWELRWYMVGDTSLRIREGVWRMREQTVTIANIQNMTVRQGPLQKLFGISDLEVHTAGGGASPSSADDLDSIAEPLHVARFRGMEDAKALRDRIQERLTLYRSAGLGDTDEHEHEHEERPPEPSAGPNGLAQAASQLRDEARALRQAMAA